MLTGTQSLDPSGLQEYLNAMTRIQNHAEEASRLKPVLDEFIYSIEESVSRMPSVVRHMLIQTAENLSRVGGNFDYSIDIVHEITGGQPNIGGNYFMVYYLRIPDEDIFFDILDRGWSGKISSTELHNRVRRAGCRQEPSLVPNRPNIEIERVGHYRHSIFTCKKFKAIFDAAGVDNTLDIQKDAISLLENAKKLSLSLVSSGFDYIEKNTLNFMIETGSVNYNLIEDPNYVAPWF